MILTDAERATLKTYIAAHPDLDDLGVSDAIHAQPSVHDPETGATAYLPSWSDTNLGTRGTKFWRVARGVVPVTGDATPQGQARYEDTNSIPLEAVAEARSS